METDEGRALILSSVVRQGAGYCKMPLLCHVWVGGERDECDDRKRALFESSSSAHQFS